MAAVNIRCLEGVDLAKVPLQLSMVNLHKKAAQQLQKLRGRLLYQ